jgi:hypothetical protein
MNELYAGVCVCVSIIAFVRCVTFLLVACIVVMLTWQFKICRLNRYRVIKKVRRLMTARNNMQNVVHAHLSTQTLHAS